eukprot:TRINITY_DN6922_c0_g1_i1.p1 TRINITY_DN6922_c0_g1~~TRINITY_DN6922_c0_g1_i1.p1  ORF type:complete len:169 (+),score=22.26 TRINITY_DN6922_c0_g1_i1:173-679(+)
MNILLFFTFSGVFFGAMSVLLHSLFILNAGYYPWNLDLEANKLLLNIPPHRSVSEHFDSFGPEAAEGIFRFATMMYTYCSMITIFASTLSMLILFFAYNNRTLFITAHSCTCIMLLLFVYQFWSYGEKSYHYRLVCGVVASNLFGLGCYLVDTLIRPPNKKKQKEARD